MADAVECQRDERVWRLVLNRPEKLNALNEDVRRALDAALTEVAEQPDVSVVVLSGAGRSFSAGADLAAGAVANPTGSRRSWAARRHGFGGWQRLLELLERIPQVTVASIHGHCIGGAALLAASCDLRIASASCTVAIPEVAIGIPLTWAGLPRLAREIGLPLTRDLVLTGRTMDSTEARACGFVQRLADDDQLAVATDALIDELLAMPAAPLAMTRAALAAMSRAELAATGWADADVLGWSLAEPESADAAADYVRRRLARPTPPAT